jgi:dihydrofolate reductase
MIGIISSTSINGVIGIYKDGFGKLPFHYPDDMRYFRETTRGSIVIMGRKTFESIGKPLPKRENIVITSQNLEVSGVTCHRSIASALKAESVKLRDHAVNIWFIGGSGIYQEAMLYADEIHLTLIPDYIDDQNSIKFPFINPIMFDLCGYKQLSDQPTDKLICAIYNRKKKNNHYEKVINETKLLKDK